MKDQLDVTILFHFLCAQHVSDINISIIGSLCKFTLKLNDPSLQNKTTDVVIQQHSRKLLMIERMKDQLEIHIINYINNALITKQPMKNTTHKRTQ